MAPSTNPLDYAPCKVPLRRAKCFDIVMAVHEGIYDDVMEADRRWRVLGGKEFFLVRQADTGSFSCRASVGHSRAVAMDFDWNSQPMGPKRTPCPQLPGMREFYEECFKPLGYGWGDNWRSKCDGMHVSKLLSEGGNGILYQTWPHGEEDDLALVKQEAWDKLAREVSALDERTTVHVLKEGKKVPLGIDRLILAMAKNPGKVLIGPNGEWLGD